MALLMVMGLFLLIDALAEHKLRQALKERNATIPDQRRKPTQIPTIRWVFQLFEGLHILLVRQNGQVMLRQLLNLRPAQQQVISLLGPQVQKCYLFSSCGVECGSRGAKGGFRITASIKDPAGFLAGFQYIAWRCAQCCAAFY
jgi:hypothetical protein